MRTKFGLVVGAMVALVLAGCGTTDHMDESSGMMMDDGMEATEFVVTIEVLANSPTPLAPVAWAVHRGTNPFVDADMMGRLDGLEALAEDGNPAGAAESVSMIDGVSSHGVANTPVGSSGPGPATPGSAYSFNVSAHAGDHLSFATMYVQSNDLFFSPGSNGVALYDMDMALSGDITDQILLYDAGTEMNEELGMGPNQAPRQSEPNMGMDEMGQVMALDMMDDMYPTASAVIRVTIKKHEEMM